MISIPANLLPVKSIKITVLIEFELGLYKKFELRSHLQGDLNVFIHKNYLWHDFNYMNELTNYYAECETCFHVLQFVYKFSTIRT